MVTNPSRGKIMIEEGRQFDEVELVEEQPHFLRMEKKKLIVNSQTRLYC